jgi:hypothetical protein
MGVHAGAGAHRFKPGAWLAVTTPNQLSRLSLATLIVRHRFSAFPDAYYPIHRTLLLKTSVTQRKTAGSRRSSSSTHGRAAFQRQPGTTRGRSQICSHAGYPTI